VIRTLRTEKYGNVEIAATLPDGLYRVESTKGLTLNSNILDVVQCNAQLIGRQTPSKELDWQLKRVAQGVYIFYKQNKRECMYTHPTNDVRSFYFQPSGAPSYTNNTAQSVSYAVDGTQIMKEETCNLHNLCGSETLNEDGDIDQNSLRTYFMILDAGNNTYYIKSMKNDGYLQLHSKGIDFTKSKKQASTFTITPQQ
jgi:hypothetical protein